MTGFVETLMHYRKGAVIEAATEELTAVVAACRATGKAGSITLKLTITPEKHGNQMKLAANVARKEPTADLPEAIFFADQEGGLHRFDPDQRELFGEAGEDRRSISQRASVTG